MTRAFVRAKGGRVIHYSAAAYAERLLIIAGTASTVSTPANISADAANILTVMGSPKNIMPAAEPNIPEVERRIATWVAEVYF